MVPVSTIPGVQHYKASTGFWVIPRKLYIFDPGTITSEINWFIPIFLTKIKIDVVYMYCTIGYTLDLTYLCDLYTLNADVRVKMSFP